MGKIIPLSKQQINYIAKLNNEGKQAYNSGGDQAILMSLANKMHKIKPLLDNASHGELDHYCQRYEGFYHYMKMLEQMAKGYASGAFNDL